MAVRRGLRSVPEGESPPVDPPAKPPQTVADAVLSGSKRDVLVAMRARIAKAVDDPKTPKRDLAALTKRLIEVMGDIDTIDAQPEGDDAATVPDEQWDGTEG